MNYFNYFSEIEETFVRRRGRNLLLSPLDWALIEDWQERGIPLRIVLNAIGKIFDNLDKQPAKKQTVKSLTYCREEIEAQYADWLATQVGKNGAGKIQDSDFETPNFVKDNSSENDLFSDDIAAHLERVSIDLEKSRQKAGGELRETLGKISRDLANLPQNAPDTETLEKTLENLDAQIDEALLKIDGAEKLKGEIEKQIASYKTRMEREVYRRTFDLMLLKRLRETAEIPRLSLFYL